MNIESLLEFWANWRIKREDGGLGYKSGRMNMMMAGGNLLPRVAFSDSDLPYGIDTNSVGSAVDTEVCRLTPRQRTIVMLEYCRIGTQAAKAAGVGKSGISQSTYANHLREAKIRLSMSPSLARLLSE